MAKQIVVADSSLLIDYFRKSGKANSLLMTLFDQGCDFIIAAITHYEIYPGAIAIQFPFWKQVLNRIMVLPFDEAVSQIAVDVNSSR